MKKVLLIDDDELVSYALQRFLEKSNYEVKSLTSGVGALNELSKFLPDIVVTDIIMPDIEGIELITNIRQVNREIPIIAMSGGSRKLGSSHLISAKLLGANETLEKPFDEEKLVEIIENLTN